jgi:predicted NAD-dependent protein-ADP-ribosyltransferase YbiA (DUF1768 family)
MKISQLFLVLSILISGCVSSGQQILTTSQDGFPDVWWQPVPPEQVAGWEIPPQAADRSKGEVILSKRNELGQFSNLAATPFTLDGDSYASVEGLWQGMKYPEGPGDERLSDSSIHWPYTRAQVMQMSGFEAKHAGDAANAIMRKLGIKWVSYHGQKIEYYGKDKQEHYELILRACRAKLEQNPEVARLLLSTKDLRFFPDHKQSPTAAPAEKYHEIYMRLRAELQAK